MDISGYTAEQIRQMPELAHLYEAVLFLEKNKGKILFPQKYEAGILGLVEEDIYELFEQQPAMPLKDVIAAIVPTFSPDLSGALILKMTEEIIKKWEKLSETVHQQAHELVLA